MLKYLLKILINLFVKALDILNTKNIPTQVIITIKLALN